MALNSVMVSQCLIVFAFVHQSLFKTDLIKQHCEPRLSNQHLSSAALGSSPAVQSLSFTNKICFWHRDGERKNRWEKEREWEILAEVPERLQIPLPQLWELSNSHPQDTLCQMAQLASWRTRPHGGVAQVSAFPPQGLCHRSLQSLEHEHPLLAHLHHFVLPN